MQQRFLIEWPGAAWWVGAVGFGLLLAALVLAERQPWSKGFRTYLMASRLVLGILLVVTMAKPILHRYENYEVRPLVGLAVDDSRSVGRFAEGRTDSLAARLQRMKAALEQGGYRVAVSRIGGDTTLADLRFDQTRSDLQTLAYLAREPRGEAKVAATVLVSDGLFNEGSNPILSPPRMPTYTLGVGDTVRRPDTRIAALKVNRVVAAEANYTARVEVAAQGIESQRLNLVLEQDGQPVGSRLLALGGTARRALVDFTLPAGAVGTRSLRVKLQPAPGEKITGNNTAAAFVEVARLAKRVLLAAGAPHPDLKAIRAALEPIDQLELVPYTVGISPPSAGRFDVVILHGLPARGRVLPPVVEQAAARLPVWYILTSETDLAAFSAQQPVLKIQSSGGQDEVGAGFNPLFTRFLTDAVRADVFRTLPPLQTPFGAYAPGASTQTLLTQQVGRVESGKPLWIYGSGSGHAASSVLAGEGIWQWRLKESFDEGKPVVVDYLISRTVQLLAAQAERKRFRFQPLTPVSDLGTPVAFEAYVEDRAGQPSPGGPIEVSLTGPKGQSRRLTLQSADGSTGLEMIDLPEGTYTYRATTRLAGEVLQDQGRFSIQATDLEDIGAGADFGMLRRLAEATGARFASLGQEQQLVDALVKARPAATLHSRERADLLIKEWWWIAGLCLLYLAEIGARKLKGGN